MQKCRATQTPMENNLHSPNSPGEEPTDDDDTPYQNAVGSLIYLAQATRPDLARAVSTIS